MRLLLCFPNDVFSVLVSEEFVSHVLRWYFSENACALHGAVFNDYVHVHVYIKHADFSGIKNKMTNYCSVIVCEQDEDYFEIKAIRNLLLEVR